MPRMYILLRQRVRIRVLRFFRQMQCLYRWLSGELRGRWRRLYRLQRRMCQRLRWMWKRKLHRWL